MLRWRPIKKLISYFVINVMKICTSSVGLILAVALSGSIVCLASNSNAAPAYSSPEVKMEVNWQKFLARQDLVWNTLPKDWESGAFIGNGLLGAMIYAGGTNALQWDVGRSDVTDHGDRIAIGRFVLVPPGKPTGGTMRLDLWNAEARGDLKTTDGDIHWRSFTHAKDLVSVIELTGPAGESSQIIFQHIPALPARLQYHHQPVPDKDKNPEPTSGKTDGVNWCAQKLHDDCAYAVAWAEKTVSPGHRLFFFTVSYTKNGDPTPAAVAHIQSALKANFDDFVASHREWWHHYYPKSFLSIPDARMESFYWIQMYKLASATRADRPAIDLMGPWFRRTPWPHIWWNLNIELTYWPVYAANHLGIGESFIRLINDDFTNFINNVPKQWRYDSAGVGRSSPYDGIRSVANATATNGILERGDLTWALNNYWLQYRYSGDERLLLGAQTNGEGGLYPKLKRAIGYYLHLLSRGADGKLHLPLCLSPEYPNPHGHGDALEHDSNYDLSLLRWGLNTLLAINERYHLNDPLARKWRDTLKNLTPNPVDKNGYMVGSDQPFAVSHRHFSHLFAIFPLHLVDSQAAKDRPLIEKSLDHWESMPKAWRGYSYTGASAMSSWLGRKDDALKYMQEFLDKPKTVLPNTMYVEAGPVIETPLSGVFSIQQMVLQSWSMTTFGTHIRVFPAVPDSWKNVSFDNLLAEGAFEVSAVRKDGKTEFVQIKSLAGNPCRVQTGLEGKVIASGDRKFNVTTETDRDDQPITVIDLKKGETVLLTSPDEKLSPADLAIKPVPTKGIKNYYGSPKNHDDRSAK
jgi:alpha-L-fucosidase 2